MVMYQELNVLNVEKIFFEKRPIIECQECYRAYTDFLITYSNYKSVFENIIGLSVNSITMDIEYGIKEADPDPVEHPPELETLYT